MKVESGKEIYLTKLNKDRYAETIEPHKLISNIYYFNVLKVQIIHASGKSIVDRDLLKAEFLFYQSSE